MGVSDGEFDKVGCPVGACDCWLDDGPFDGIEVGVHDGWYDKRVCSVGPCDGCLDPFVGRELGI